MCSACAAYYGQCLKAVIYNRHPANCVQSGVGLAYQLVKCGGPLSTPANRNKQWWPISSSGQPMFLHCIELRNINAVSLWHLLCFIVNLGLCEVLWAYSAGSSFANLVNNANFVTLTCEYVLSKASNCCFMKIELLQCDCMFFLLFHSCVGIALNHSF